MKTSVYMESKNTKTAMYVQIFFIKSQLQGKAGWLDMDE